MMVLVGGERGIAKLAQNPHTKRMVGHFLDAMKPVVAMNEAVSLLAMPGKLEGRSVAGDTTDPALAATGANVADETIVQDGNLMTLRGEDMTALIEAMLGHLANAEELAAA